MVGGGEEHDRGLDRACPGHGVFLWAREEAPLARPSLVGTRTEARPCPWPSGGIQEKRARGILSGSLGHLHVVSRLYCFDELLKLNTFNPELPICASAPKKLKTKT